MLLEIQLDEEVLMAGLAVCDLLCNFLRLFNANAMLKIYRQWVVIIIQLNVWPGISIAWAHLCF